MPSTGPSTGRHVTLLTEGTYPHVHGGVSTWCDQLIRGMPEVDFHVLALTGSGREPVTWELPPDLTAHTAFPLWGAGPEGRLDRPPHRPVARRPLAPRPGGRRPGMTSSATTVRSPGSPTTGAWPWA